VFVIRLLII